MDAKSLDRNSPVPLYVQIEDFIRHEIATGSWKPGERIPSEAALNAALGVSRMTVRGVLNGLVSDGLLQRVPGHLRHPPEDRDAPPGLQRCP